MPKGNGKDSFRVSLSSSSESESPEPRAAEPGPNASDSGPSSSSEELFPAVPEGGLRSEKARAWKKARAAARKEKARPTNVGTARSALGPMSHPGSSTSGRTRRVCAGNYIWYRGYSWEEAERRAGALKEQRTSGVCEDPSQEERREKQRHKQERKDKKEKEKKKATRPHVDPSHLPRYA